MNGENRTQRTIKKKKRRKKRYLLKLTIIIAACIGLHFLLHIEYFTVDGITVAGNKEISDEEIIKLAEISTGENIFDIHPMFAEKKIKKNLYIEDVNVKRLLPNRIDVVVSERSGKAQFIKGEKYVVTDNDGRVLEIAEEEQKATLVENVRVEKARPDKTIDVKEEETYNKAMELIKVTEAGDLYFKRLVIDGKNVEAYVYDSLVCKGEYNDVMESIQSGALKSVVFDLYQKGKKKGVINIGTNNYCSFTPKK